MLLRRPDPYLFRTSQKIQPTPESQFAWMISFLSLLAVIVVAFIAIYF